MRYPSSLTDSQWNAIRKFLSRPDPRGARSRHDKREIVDAILYVNKTGCQWRMLPLHFPPWSCVYDHFRRLKQRGVWQEIVRALNERNRKKGGARPSPRPS